MPNSLELVQEDEVDISTVRIMDSSRMPKFALTMVWWGLCSAMVYLIIGATLALYYGTTNALIGMSMSVIVYSAVNYVLTNHAIRTGLSVSLFSRVLFGNAGAALATLIFAATVIYYTVFESSVIAVALNSLFPSVSWPLACLVVVVYSVPLVFGSVQNWLDKLNGVLLPLYAAGLIAAVTLATTTHGYSPAWMHFGESSKGPAVSNGWWDCFVYYMGIWLFMLAAFDFARFGKKQHARYHSLINFGMPFWLVTFMVNGIIGIYLVSTISGQGTLSEVSVVLALIRLMGLWGLGFLVVTQTRINTANYYLATINTQALFEAGLGLKLPKFVWAIVVGAIVYALMLSGIFSKLLLALAYQGVFVVAWVAVALAHILSHKSERTSDDAVEASLCDAPTFNAGGLIAWFVGVAAGIGVMNGPESIHTFSAPATFVISAAAYLMVSMYVKRVIPATV